MSSTAVAAPATARTAQAWLLVLFRGIGQVFFQENALTGVCFVVGIALSSPTMAVGAVVGALIGTLTAFALKFDEGEWHAGIYGFNATLVGIATLFFFQPGAASAALLLAGAVGATLLTRLMRQHVPFPTYTTPFIVTTWVIYFLAPALGAARVESAAAGPGPAGIGAFSIEAVGHGVSQVMFQASIWTGLLFVVGIALNDRTHAGWVVLASVVGTLTAGYHATADSGAVHIERLFDHTHGENIALGLYGYNATLAAVALSLWRRSLIPILLGALLSVPLTEVVPLLGLPALTAPFVLATWLVMLFDWLDGKLFPPPVARAH